MRAPSLDLILETRRATMFYNALVGVIGGILVAGAVLASEEDWLVVALSLAGGSLVSAALVSFVFGSITIRDTTRQVDRAVTTALQDVLAPVRESLFANALGSYRWDCYLEASAGRGQGEYVDQSLRIGYRTPEVPSELRMICVSSWRDDVLTPFGEDNRYIFRWLIDDGLDPADPDVFSVGEVLVDGTAVGAHDSINRDVEGFRAHEYRYTVPGRMLGSVSRTLEFSVRLAKRLEGERQIRIQTNLFKLVTDGEFRLGVGPRIGATRVEPSTAQVVAVGPGVGAVSAPAFSAPYEAVAAVIKIPFPMQAGSSIVFRVNR